MKARICGRKTVKMKLIYTLTIWVFVFALLEFGLRFHEYVEKSKKANAKSTYNPASIYVPHPFAAYALNPDHPDHNTQGYRANENRLYDADPDSTTIVCLGGSSTYGTRVFKEDSYPYLLEATLSESVDKPINVINAGVPGYNTPNIISFLSLRVVHLKPDIVIFYVGYNDAASRIFYPGYRNDYSHAQKSWEMPETPFWRHSRLLDVLAGKLGYSFARDPHLLSVAWRQNGGRPEVNWHNSSGEAFKRNLMTLVGITRTHSAIPILVTQARNLKNHPLEGDSNVWMQTALAEHTAIIKQVANDMSVNVIDLHDLMTDKGEYFADRFHMNEKGNRKRAEIIADYLTKNELLED